MKIILLVLAVLVSTSCAFTLGKTKRQIKSLGGGTGKVLVEFQKNFTIWERGATHRSINISDAIIQRVEAYSDNYNLLRNTLVLKPITTSLVKSLFDDSTSFRRSLERFTKASQMIKSARQKFLPLLRNDIREIQQRIIKSPSALKCLEANKQRIGSILTRFWIHVDPFIVKAFAELDARQKNFAHIIVEAVSRRETFAQKSCKLAASPTTWNISQRNCYANYYIKIERDVLAEFKRYQSSANTNFEALYSQINLSIDHVIKVSIKEYKIVKAALDTCMVSRPIHPVHV